MNSPTKKSLFFLVLSIVCNFTLSDKIDDCEDDILEIFREDMVSVAHFDYAMFAFSLPFFNSMENTENIREYFESNDDIIEIKELGNKTMIKEHLSLMRYFENLQSQRDMRRESREVNNSSLQSNILKSKN